MDLNQPVGESWDVALPESIKQLAVLAFAVALGSISYQVYSANTLEFIMASLV